MNILIFIGATCAMAGCANQAPDAQSMAPTPPKTAPAGIGDVKTGGADFHYMANGQKMEGYLATTENYSEKKQPGILIVHDWNGLDDHEKDVARRLSRHGYVVLAIDVYGVGVRPKTVAECSSESSKYYGNAQLWHERLKAGLDALKSLPNVDPNRIGAVGYCFGGSAVLEMARKKMPVIAVVSMHGGLVGPSKATSKPIASILELHGNADPMSTPNQVAAFKTEMKSVGADFRSLGYDGVGHAFAVKGSDKLGIKGVGYDEGADRWSWDLMLKHFEATLKK